MHMRHTADVMQRAQRHGAAPAARSPAERGAAATPSGIVAGSGVPHSGISVACISPSVPDAADGDAAACEAMRIAIVADGASYVDGAVSDCDSTVDVMLPVAEVRRSRALLTGEARVAASRPLASAGRGSSGGIGDGRAAISHGWLIGAMLEAPMAALRSPMEAPMQAPTVASAGASAGRRAAAPRLPIGATVVAGISVGAVASAAVPGAGVGFLQDSDDRGLRPPSPHRAPRPPPPPPPRPSLQFRDPYGDDDDGGDGCDPWRVARCWRSVLQALSISGGGMM